MIEAAIEIKKNLFTEENKNSFIQNIIIKKNNCYP